MQMIILELLGFNFCLMADNLGSEDLIFPYSFSWNTSAAGNGIHTISARARDAAGNITTSAGVDFTINNDVQDPTVNITSPTAGTVSGTINVNANANDNVGCQLVFNSCLMDHCLVRKMFQRSVFDFLEYVNSNKWNI